MAFAATMSTGVGIDRAYSQGPNKIQYFTWTTVSGDTSGTITATGLTSAKFVVLDGGLDYTAAPTFSGNQVTLAFTDPVASRFGSGFVVGV